MGICSKACFAASFLLAIRAYATPIEDCNSTDPAKMLTGCSTVLATAKTPEERLGALARRGFAEKESGKCDAAITDLSAALELAPNTAAMLTLRGECYGTLNQAERAHDDLAAALRLDPENAEARAAMSRLAPTEASPPTLPPSAATPSAASAEKAPGPVGSPEGPWREQFHWLPTHDDAGRQFLLLARICRPPGSTPARVVVVAHGLNVGFAGLSRMRPRACEDEEVRWFLERGYVVVLALRRGFGSSEGSLAEAPRSGMCVDADFPRFGREAARDIAATVDYATGLPFARSNGAVVVGVSAGGWGVIAYNAAPHPRVVALVNFAGGTGGRRHNQPNNNCRPDELAEAAGRLANGATTRMLWIYAQNDTFFGPQIATALYRAYIRGGGHAEFVPVEAFGAEGHYLFDASGGSRIWGPLVEKYLVDVDHQEASAIGPSSEARRPASTPSQIGSDGGHRGGFAAFARDEASHRIGLSWNEYDQSKADLSAISGCVEQGCQIAFRFGPNRCGALATTEDGRVWGGADRPTLAGAQLAAIENCQRRTTVQCKVRGSACNW